MRALVRRIRRTDDHPNRAAAFMRVKMNSMDPFSILFANAFLSFVRMIRFSDISKSLNHPHSPAQFLRVCLLSRKYIFFKPFSNFEQFELWAGGFWGLFASCLPQISNSFVSPHHPTMLAPPPPPSMALPLPHPPPSKLKGA